MSSKKPWSKLKKELTKLWVDSPTLDIHQAVYRMDSQRGSTDLPRYFLTLDKEIIFDYPRMFLNHVNYTDSWRETPRDYVVSETYPHINEVSQISSVIRDYIDTPKEKLLEPLEKDNWDLCDIFRAMDSRLGKARLQAWAKTLSPSSPVHKILEKRFPVSK